MKIFDLTLIISDTLLTWPGDPKTKINRVKDLNKKDTVNLSKLNLSAHTGTHMDAPAHFLKNGKTIDEIDLTPLLGKCLVKNIKGNEITRQDIKKLNLSGSQAVLFRTKNTVRKLLFKKKFDKNYVALTLAAAEEIVKRKIKVVGIDYLSIGKLQGTNNIDVHKLLLKHKVIIIESLNMQGLTEGYYNLIALPIKIKKGDGAPSRVLLTKKT